MPACTVVVREGGIAYEVAVFAAAQGVEVEAGESAELGRFFAVWGAVKSLAGLRGVKDTCR
jgi:hypothetical protein